MKRKLFPLCALALSLCCAISFAGCGSTAPYIVDVRTVETENGAAYEYVYSDGSIKSMPAQKGENGADGKDGTDGANGKDGQNVSAEDIYKLWLEKHGLSDSADNYDAFLSEYLTLTVSKEHTEAIQQSMLSTATLYCDYVQGMRNPWNPARVTYNLAQNIGTAVVYSVGDNYTYLITNYHVVYCANADASANGSDKYPLSIHCFLYGSYSFEAPFTEGEADPTYGYTTRDYNEYAVDCELVGGSATADLAVVKAKTSDLLAVNPDMHAAEFAEDYRAGQTVYTIGNLFAKGFTVTAGIISVDDDYVELTIGGSTRLYRSIRTDAFINEGNSGGGMFDIDGKLVGLVNSGNTSYTSINYAIPLSIVTTVVENILSSRDGKVYKPTIGVTVETKNTKFEYDARKGYGKIREDVNIVSVAEGSIAQRAGLQAGDTVTAITIDDTAFPISRDFHISDALYAVRAGSTIAVTVTRGGQTVTVKTTVAESELNEVV